ncbi:DUF5959 family protein [Streptomyces aurantiogriseus]|uniref:DUF5959 family protein n=1 Tax=Streptomyces aurantiogriseus TaxID=66870 RepID=UPI00167807F8|nr:DUF5959 family protein [Streptomyces aurantiogriseus]
MDLVHLEDADGNRCIVRVTGRYKPGVLPGHDTLRADVLVSASFVDARLETYVPQRHLDAWQRGLTGLVPGKDTRIGGDRGLKLILHMLEDRSLAVTVHDPDRLTTLLGIRPEENWVEEHHQRLEQVRQTWPSEVVETAPLTYAWSPDRQA